MKFKYRVKPSLDAKTITDTAPYYGLYFLSGTQSDFDERIEMFGGENIQDLEALATVAPSLFNFTHFRVLYAVYESLSELNKAVKKFSKYGFYLYVVGRNSNVFPQLVRSDDLDFDNERSGGRIQVWGYGSYSLISSFYSFSDVIDFYRKNGGIKFYFVI